MILRMGFMEKELGKKVHLTLTEDLVYNIIEHIQYLV